MEDPEVMAATPRPNPVDIVVGRGSLTVSVMSNILAATLDGQAIVASCDEFGQYDDRIIRLEPAGPDSDPLSVVRVSLVPKK